MRHNNAAVQDTRLITQLERLRQEAEMRRARLWWHEEFWPRTAGDYLKIEMAHGTRENRWLRQVVTYWGMAASFVLDHTLSEKAFFRREFSEEMFAVFVKLQPFLKQLRQRMRDSEFMGNVEKVIFSSEMGRERLREAANAKQRGSASLSAMTGMERRGAIREGNRQRL
jgi:hypothetical protein